MINITRAFSVASPFFGFLAGGHIAELAAALRDDAFGLRERLTVVYGEPYWQKLADIQEACTALPCESHKPEDFIAQLLYHLLSYTIQKEAAAAASSKDLDDVHIYTCRFTYTYASPRIYHTIFDPIIQRLLTCIHLNM